MEVVMKLFEVTTDVLQPNQYTKQVAVNEEYVPGTEQVKPGDRVAFIPPVSGG
jgi:molybdopterin converting factor small subunit